jgi:hypothetical protein
MYPNNPTPELSVHQRQRELCPEAFPLESVSVTSCSRQREQEVTTETVKPDKESPTDATIGLWRLSRLLGVSWATLEREIDRGRLVGRLVRVPFRPRTRETVIPLRELQRYLAQRGFNQQLPDNLAELPFAPLAVSAQQLAQRGELSLRTLRRDIREGKLPTIRIARRVVVSTEEAQRYLEMRSGKSQKDQLP